jgi:hypothetical protein
MVEPGHARGFQPDGPGPLAAADARNERAAHRAHRCGRIESSLPCFSDRISQLRIAALADRSI